MVPGPRILSITVSPGGGWGGLLEPMERPSLEKKPVAVGPYSFR